MLAWSTGLGPVFVDVVTRWTTRSIFFLSHVVGWVIAVHQSWQEAKRISVDVFVECDCAGA